MKGRASDQLPLLPAIVIQVCQCIGQKGSLGTGYSGRNPSWWNRRLGHNSTLQVAACRQTRDLGCSVASAVRATVPGCRSLIQDIPNQAIHNRRSCCQRKIYAEHHIHHSQGLQSKFITLQINCYGDHARCCILFSAHRESEQLPHLKTNRVHPPS